jgi:hypothetical protein
VADALNRKSFLLSQLSTNIACFEAVKESYPLDQNLALVIRHY